MTTVHARRVASTPARSPTETWQTICGILGTRGKSATAFEAVTGIMSAIIADQYPKSNPIVVRGTGPRVRLYCIYGDAALGDEANEAPVHVDLLDGDWDVFVPVGPQDFTWVQRALKAHPGFRPYDPKTGIPTDESIEHAAIVPMQPNQGAWAKL